MSADGEALCEWYLLFAWSGAQPFSVSSPQKTLGERHDNCSVALPEIYEPKSSLSSAPQHMVMVHPRRPRGPCPFSDFQLASHWDTGYDGPAHLMFRDLEKNGITDMVSIILPRQPLPCSFQARLPRNMPVNSEKSYPQRNPNLTYGLTDKL